MTGINKIFIDTAPIIYFLENHTTYGSKMLNIINTCLDNNIMILMSVLGCGEYLTIPYRDNKQTKINNFEHFIDDLNIQVFEINMDIMKIAAKLRAKYTSIKMPDAIQLATAINTKCDIFLHNDFQLRQIDEIKTVLIDNWT